MDFSMLGETFSGVIAVAAGLHAIVKTFKFVQEGEEGIKLRFGKARRDRSSNQPIIYKPGFTVLIPYVDTLVRRHVRIQTIDLPQQTITIKNGLSYVVDAVVRFRVTDIYAALFRVDDLDLVMSNVAMSALRDVLTPYEDSKAMSDVRGMSDLLTRRIAEHSNNWGVKIEEFSVVSCVPTPESQQIVNVLAGVQARVIALKEGFRDLGIELADSPQLAAALVGIPVSTAIGVSPAGSDQFTMKGPKAKKSEGD